ncbi:PREDICTED: Meckel syndrome type 1 protein-like [Branchiostoma belcheri]|uniref:Meckel syndrome type 1 protein-like n=1 Tax=Branchiostoma belcheri TaxID=7741 RepID=A0A6P4YCH1_BRABE|nr:PREDICTED: Meckel syndrome type 1 protein-like [Branchiostoma belcheri]
MDNWSTDKSTAYYRSRDPINNFRIKVTLHRITSATIIPQHNVVQQEGQTNVEMGDMGSRASMGPRPDDREEFTLQWQQKLFSQREMDVYSNKDNVFTYLDEKYNHEVTSLEQKGGRPNKRIFSYVDHDRFTNMEEYETMTTSPNEEQSFLVDRMSQVRRRRQAAADRGGNIPRNKNLVNMKPTEDFLRNNHVINTPQQTMYIMADLSARNRTPELSDEYVLCSIQVDNNGVISIKPDFNRSRGPYRLETEGERKEIYEYTLQHVSKPMSSQEQDREHKMYKELYAKHIETLAASVGEQFEMPPPGILRLNLYGEIVSARNFEYDNLHINFFLELPKNWTSDHGQQLSGVTHTVTTKVEGKDNVAYFSYPFEYEVFFRNETEDDMPQWPLLFLQVLSVDSWQRYRTEGYGYCGVPSAPGVHHKTVHTWRPVGNSLVDPMRRFFIGGSPELEDPTYTAVPTTFDGQRLSKFGFRTESSGSIQIKLYCVQQSQAFLETTTKKRKTATLLDRLGGMSAQSNIMNVLDAFQKARKRMQSARENLASTMGAT